MDIQQIDHEIKKVIRAAWNVESTKMKKAETLNVSIMIPGNTYVEVKGNETFSDLITDLCYNEAFMHGLVMVEEPAIIETELSGKDYTKVFLVMIRMQDVPDYVKLIKAEKHD